MKIARNLTKRDIARELGVTPHHRFVTGPWSQIEAEAAKGAKSGEIEVMGIKVPFQITSYSKRFLAAIVPAESLEAFKAQATSFIGRGTLAKELGIYIDHPIIEAAWRQIGLQLNSGAENGTIVVEGKLVEWNCSYSPLPKCAYVSRASIDAFRAAVNKLPGKADANSLSVSHLVEKLGVKRYHPVIVDVCERIDAAIKSGKTSGEVYVADGKVEWSLLRGARGKPSHSHWGAAKPHFPTSSLPLLEEAIRRANGLDNQRKILRSICHATVRDTVAPPGSTEIDVEDEIEIGLVFSKPGSHLSVPLTVLAVPTANENYLFEVFGIRHVVTSDRKVMQRMEIDGGVGWRPSLFLSVDPEFNFGNSSNMAPLRPRVL
ncbi:hypothetical protein OIU34_23590 [Pararhizobium sp. BT-229]|uniref:hypothetical protein n=1 Tax=Pararhizobium sp. BT-229 TaxID=2986923 RepID=UPI0021F7B1A0|nr:hypothetical protein [Pararhizobium sp. BT-229]MCV9964880.1 hypothetical protein [Pararhizobium sp. BT-229]